MTNPVGIYYAYWTQQWDVEFHPFIDRAADLGFDQLEINAGTVTRMDPAARRSLASHARDRQIRLSYCVGLPPEFDLAAESAATRRAAVRFLQQMASAIGDMGGGVLGGIIYGCWPAALPQGVIDRRPFIDRSLKSMREALVAAEDNNVLFCLEVVNRFEQFIMNTAEEGVAYIERLNSPNAKLMLDTFHMNIEETSLRGAVEHAGEHLAHLHIGENDRTPPGLGHLSWEELIQALHTIGYEGSLVMEPFVTPGGEVGRDIRVHRDLKGSMDLDVEAEKALRFVRELLDADRS